ncbi:hypothetical protein BOX15_Mlig021540g1 [Macrostomum lignano]|uniref:Proline dehydrogenase n=2 Tax=Macrostomum lignano TaxID=282301 RepID=A0A267DZ52_9PLAT|nr:hypothetical protein BOX15_Mlig021540g1 [Macrostomum lignano]
MLLRGLPKFALQRLVSARLLCVGIEPRTDAGQLPITGIVTGSGPAGIGSTGSTIGTKIFNEPPNDVIFTAIESRKCLSMGTKSTSSSNARDAKSDINFLDYRAVQASKTRAELIRALAVLHLCSIDLFVSRALLWMRLGRRLLGQRCFDALMRRSFFGQFVGGATEAELRQTAEAQRRQGLRPMIAVPMEEPMRKLSDEELTRLYEENTAKQVRAVELSAQLNSNRPKMQLKLTSLMPTSLLQKLATLHGDLAVADAASEVLSQLLQLAVPDTPCSTKSRQQQQDLLRRLLPAASDAGRLSDQLLAAVVRTRRVFDAAKRHSVQILIDAEYSHINPGISLFYLALATVYNAEDYCMVFNTYQCYLRDTIDTYNWHMDLLLSTSRRGVRAGAKIVRGAYLHWENGQGAEINGGRSRVWSSLEETNCSYNRAVSIALDRIVTEGSNSSRHEVILATQNSNSISLCLDGMRRRCISPESGAVSFGQLYGMADYISVPLAQSGYQVYKSIPYGSVDETLLYLVRRANENKLIFDGVREEKSVLRAALRAGRA